MPRTRKYPEELLEGGARMRRQATWGRHHRAAATAEASLERSFESQMETQGDLAGDAREGRDKGRPSDDDRFETFCLIM